MNNKQDHRNRDAGISDIEGGPGMRVADMQIEEKKIDHVPIKKTIGKITQDASEKSASERSRHHRVLPPHEKNQNNQKRDR